MKDTIKPEPNTGSFHDILTPDQLRDLEQSGCFETQPGVKLPFVPAGYPSHYWLGEGLLLHVDTASNGEWIMSFCAVRGNHEDYFKTLQAETAWQSSPSEPNKIASSPVSGAN